MKTEGRNAVLELFKTDKTIEKVMLEKGAQGTLGKIFAEARRQNVRVQFVDRAVLDKESVTGRHQGVIAFTTAFSYSALEELYADGDSLIVLCDGIEDVHNLGSILRVAECAGASGVVIPAAKGATVTEAVIRISAGAAEHIKVAKVPSVNRLPLFAGWISGITPEDFVGESIHARCRPRLSGERRTCVGRMRRHDVPLPFHYRTRRQYLSDGWCIRPDRHHATDETATGLSHLAMGRIPVGWP